MNEATAPAQDAVGSSVGRLGALQMVKAQVRLEGATMTEFALPATWSSPASTVEFVPGALHATWEDDRLVSVSVTSAGRAADGGYAIAQWNSWGTHDATPVGAPAELLALAEQARTVAVEALQAVGR